MWDSNAPLQLLKSMPKKLSKENLEKIQMVIDADKYKNSLVSGFDLCGMYAPFCRDCKKTSIFPCALAYINMLKADGMDVEIDAKPLNSQEIKNFPSVKKQSEETSAPEIKQVEEETAVAVDEPVAEKEVQSTEFESAEQNEEAVVSAAEKPVVQPVEGQESKPARKIRIAVARKKIL